MRERLNLKKLRVIGYEAKLPNYSLNRMRLLALVEARVHARRESRVCAEGACWQQICAGCLNETGLGIGWTQWQAHVPTVKSQW
jgi:hypothetical protein